MDMNNTKKCIFILQLVVYIVAPIAYVKAELQRFDHQPTKVDGSLDILVIGDWGRRGLYNQSNVAFQMGKVGEELDVDFIISTGDNFYDDGLTDEEDPLFVESFTEVYTSNSLQKQWYSVLGNHDYRGNVLAQLSPALRQRDSKWLCLRSFIVNSGNAEFFFVDTTPFQDKYFTEDKHEYDWRGVLPREEYLSNVLKEVDMALEESSAQWKIVIGHHTIFSAGHHGNTQELVGQLLPILEMGKVGEKLDADFIISTGDNFYEDGLLDEEDDLFVESFTQVYTATSLQKQWYSVLGNHDYRGNALAQLSPVLTQKDNKWLCLRSFVVNSGIVEFFFFDTTPFQDKYFTEEDHKYDWRGVLPRDKYLSNALKELDTALEESSAKWKIVIGHHTIFSAGHHGNTQELVDQLLPILEAKEVDLYINGHDHCLQHISSQSQLQFLTSGGGSKAWTGEITPWDPNEMKFYYDGQGFMTLRVTENEISVAFYDVFGEIIHKWSTTKNTHMDS